MTPLSQIYHLLVQEHSELQVSTVLNDFLRDSPRDDVEFLVKVVCRSDEYKLFSAAKAKKLLLSLVEVNDWMLDECKKHVGDAAETLCLLVPQARPALIFDNALLVQLHHHAQISNYDNKERWFMDVFCHLDETERIYFYKLATGSSFNVNTLRPFIRALAHFFQLTNVQMALALNEWMSAEKTFSEAITIVKDQCDLNLCQTTDLTEQIPSGWVVPWLHNDIGLLFSYGGSAFIFTENLFLIPLGKSDIPHSTIVQVVTPAGYRVSSPTRGYPLLIANLEKSGFKVYSHEFHEEFDVLSQISVLKVTDSSELPVFFDKLCKTSDPGLLVIEPKNLYRIWKRPNLIIKAVLIYQRLNENPSYTFGLRGKDGFVPVVQVESVTEDEAQQLRAYVKENTLEKFGPVSSVKLALVCKVGFEYVTTSTRHKSGYNVFGGTLLEILYAEGLEQVDELSSLSTWV